MIKKDKIIVINSNFEINRFFFCYKFKKIIQYSYLKKVKYWTIFLKEDKLYFNILGK